MNRIIRLWNGRFAPPFAHRGYSCLVAAAASLALAIAGCSGGSGGGNPGAGGPGGIGGTGGTPPPVVGQGVGTIVVTVKDALGAPVAGARAVLWGSKTVETLTDANGRAEVKDFPEGASVSVSVSSPGWYGYGADKSVVVGGVVQFDITTFPWAEPTGGNVGVSFPNAGAEADGQTLEFTVRFAESPLATTNGWSRYLTVLSPNSCTPDPGNDAPRFEADCIAGAEGFDAPYVADDGGNALAVNRVPGAPAAPLAAALLLDQSAKVIVSDPGNSRLLAIRAFLNQLSAQGSVVLAAFAADSADGQRRALLPQKPLAIFPVDNPRFTTDVGAYLPTVDSLATLSGGAAPLYASLDAMIDFVASNAPAGARRAVVVLTDGVDDFCGTAYDCQAARQAVIQKARSRGVIIVTVGLASPSGPLNRVALGTLAQGSGGIAYQATDPKQLVAIFHTLPGLLNGSRTTYAATYRIRSTVAGSLAPGHTVLGKARLLTCAFDCDYHETEVPFAFQVP